jgi:hypothetical protein
VKLGHRLHEQAGAGQQHQRDRELSADDHFAEANGTAGGCHPPVDR